MLVADSLHAWMISEEEAFGRILNGVAPLPSHSVPLLDALELFAAHEVRATVPLPPFDNSAMDGYAVVASSATPGSRLKIVGEQPAGPSRALSVSPGEAVRIFTGGPIPIGADAVVMQEGTESDGQYVTIKADRIEAEEFVRRRGGDLTIGQVIINRGQRLRASSLALLASQGAAAVDVRRRANVAIVTTGDEIASAGTQLSPGEIFETNGVMLAALVQRAGTTLGSQSHCRDNVEELREGLLDATAADALIISGGVSVGEHDLVQQVLREIGASINLWRVSVKPGKPFLFGTRGRCAIFGLPGNPVSSFVTFVVFVRPALLRMMGAADSELALPRSKATLVERVTGDQSRPHYVRGNFVDGQFRVTGPQESHAVFGLSRANALLRVMAGQGLEAGSEVMVSLIP